MTGVGKVVGFVVVLAVAFGAALGVGHAVGPVPAAHDGGAADPVPPAQTLPGGLMVSQGGYSLRLGDDGAAAGHDVPVSFTVRGPDGEPVTSYDVEHEKRLHLIAVRRDFSGFQHVHPELSTDGTWSTLLDLAPGSWRLFADFKPAGDQPLTLGADLSVAGDYHPAHSAQEESRSFEVDGYTVTLDGELTAGADAKLTLTVSHDGQPVTDLQPYLGAYGHLVALREGDLAYLHVHPEGRPGDDSTEPGPEVVFYAAVPSPGSYRLFLDFRHEGVVRTAAFIVPTGASVPQEASSGHGH